MKQEIEFRHLRYFLAVAETLHFSKAAAQLGMAQPPLSQQIRSLERILGYPLFQRTTRGVRLTKVGEYFRERARNTVTKMQDDVEMARRLGSGHEGVLTVGFSGSVMLTTLPKAIEGYRRLYPRVELRLLEVVTAEQAPPSAGRNTGPRFSSRRRTARWAVDGIDPARTVHCGTPGSS